ncbi:MAG: porin [Pseudomonadota bacterium]
MTLLAHRVPAALSCLLAAIAVPSLSQAQTAPTGSLDADDRARAEAEAAETDAASYPRLVWGLAAEVQNDLTFSSTDPAAELNDLSPTLGAALGLELREGTGLYAGLVLEPVFDPVDDRVFEDLGLYAEELFLAAEAFGAGFVAGKFNPAFGLAWDAAPGLYGADFAEDYELTERLGGAMSFSLPGVEDGPLLTLSAFIADDTVLSESLLENRGRTRRADGGASNDDAPSFAAALEGELRSGLGYVVGARWQQAGRGDAGDEFGVSGGLTYGFELAGGEVEGVAELAWFDGLDAGPDDVLYGTLGGAYATGPWTVSAVYALREAEAAPMDHLLTASVEYALTDEVVVAAGYRFGEEGGETSHTAGLLLVVEFGGAVPLRR